MKIVRDETALRAVLDARESGTSVGYVPTMGALHEGHLSLLRAARDRCDLVVLSIFVNPLQFGAGEDLARYPSDELADVKLAEAAGTDLAFVPPADVMYPPGSTTTVDPGRLGEIVEGAARPGHFRGVATVVAKLFGQVRPDVAFFGQKDAQQVAVIRRMVSDLAIPVAIEVCPTMRDPDGLALSSRNRYLSADDRKGALALWRALQAGSRVMTEGGDARRAQNEMESVLRAEPGVEIDYAVAVDPETFEAAKPSGPTLLAVAARVGTARLIDNVSIPNTNKGTATGRES
jgi:pantoate--beta-alanine ligase